MTRTGQISRLRGMMTMLCIGMFLFSYVNATMFWHGHNVQGVWFYHSHIADRAHRTGQTDGGHTTAQLILIETVHQAAYTEAAVPEIAIEPVRPAETRTIETPSVVQDGRTLVINFSLRGPPVLA